jgi:hypothetical protein
VRRLLLTIAIVAWAGATSPRVAWAAERVAVLVVGAAADGDLAALLSDVVESQVARATDAEIAGTEELRAKLHLTSQSEVAACLADLGCLSRAAISLRVRQVITGTVGRNASEQFFSLEWRDVEQTSAPPRRVFRRVAGDLHELGRSVQSAVDELLRPPRLEVPPTAEARPASPVLVDAVTGDAIPPRKSWPAKAVWAGLGVTGLAVATGVVFGALGEREPQGTTRGEVQRSLQDLERESTVAEAALITAAVTALVTGIIAVRYWDHIGGREARSSR